MNKALDIDLWVNICFVSFFMFIVSMVIMRHHIAIGTIILTKPLRNEQPWEDTRLYWSKPSSHAWLIGYVWKGLVNPNFDILFSNTQLTLFYSLLPKQLTTYVTKSKPIWNHFLERINCRTTSDIIMIPADTTTKNPLTHYF